MSVQLDTGSDELWVNPDCAAVDDRDKAFCVATGSYDAARSSTAAALNGSASLRFGNGSVNMTYVGDSIALSSSVTLSAVRFGVASATRDQFSGILGLGFGKGVNLGYGNVVDEMAAQGATPRKMFSFALGSKHEGSGVVVFGGLDTSKFAGRLAPLPIIPAAQSPDGVTRYWVTLDSVGVTRPDGHVGVVKSGATAVFLDTGATYSLLPADVVEGVATALGAGGPGEKGLYTVDCELAQRNGTVDFTFAGTTIAVPYREMVREGATHEPQPECVLGMVASDRFTLLGDTVLRSAFGESRHGP